MADQGTAPLVADEFTTKDLADEIKDSSDRVVSALARAALFIVGGLAGVPAATWAGQVTAGQIAGSTGLLTNADAIAGAAAVGFGVVLLSSGIFTFVIAPLVGFLLEANTP